MAKDRYYEEYGITKGQYELMYDAREGKCDLCERWYPVLHVDHRHVPGYKKLPPEKKILEVRGLLCYRHNKFTIGSLEIDKDARKILNNVNHYFKMFKMKGDSQRILH